MRYYGKGQLIEVRCCCVPVKLLGWMSVPWGSIPKPGTRCAFPIPSEAPVLAGTHMTQFERATRARSTIVMEAKEIAEVDNAGGPMKMWIALSAHETSIEELRKLSNFKENRQ